MTQTPETKTPTRAEALAAFNDWLNSGDESDIALAYHAETIISALATDAPIVEGDKTAETIEQACAYLEKEMEKGFYSPDRAQLQTAIFAARLYAQGRTQSAVPEGMREVLRKLINVANNIHVTPPPEADVVNCLRKLTKQAEALLSAAPPVTGGAWLPISSAPRDGKVIRLAFDDKGEWLTCDGMFQAGAWVIAATFYDERRSPPYAFREHRSNRTPIFWQPLPPAPKEKDNG